MSRRTAICLLGAGLFAAPSPRPGNTQETIVQINPNWEFVADTVMGGVSVGQITQEMVGGRPATRLTGQVSLENNGGFVQMAFDLRSDGGVLDASDYIGIELEVYGNAEEYDLRLRTDALTRPWQSFRTDFRATPAWRSLKIPFDQMVPHKTDALFDAARLRRVGILAIGRVFEADLAVAGVRFYR